MDAEIKAEWVNALRSGEYKQGQASLRTRSYTGETSYCCLGVLCELYSRKGKGEWDSHAFNYGPMDEDYNHEGYGLLPLNLANELGIEDNPSIPGKGMTLAELNDNGMPFSQIADLIDAHL